MWTKIVSLLFAIVNSDDIKDELDIVFVYFDQY